MSTHRATVVWSRTSAVPAFEYETYSRDHDWQFGGGSRLRASAASEYKGTPALPNPEEALVAAISSCHMLTFLAICARKGIAVDRYEDAAEGHLEKNAEGRLAITKTTLRPKVAFAAGVSVDGETLAKLHEAAHRGCFIANSVKTDVTIES